MPPYCPRDHASLAINNSLQCKQHECHTAGDTVRHRSSQAPTSPSGPVEPAVPSVTAPPGARRPEANPSRMMASATRSLTLPPGLRNSALPRICFFPSRAVSVSGRRGGARRWLPREPGRVPEQIGRRQATLAYQRSLSSAGRVTPRSPPSPRGPTPAAPTQGGRGCGGRRSAGTDLAARGL